MNKRGSREEYFCKLVHLAFNLVFYSFFPLRLVSNWSDLLLDAMPDHHTRQTTTDKLEEADHRLSESHTSLSQGHQSLNSKIDTIHSSLTAQIESLFDRLAAITLQPQNELPIGLDVGPTFRQQ